MVVFPDASAESKHIHAANLTNYDPDPGLAHAQAGPTLKLKAAGPKAAGLNRAGSPTAQPSPNLRLIRRNPTLDMAPDVRILDRLRNAGHPNVPNPLVGTVKVDKGEQ